MTGQENAAAAHAQWRVGDKGAGDKGDPTAPAGEAPEEAEPRSAAREADAAWQLGSPGSLLSAAQAAVISVHDAVTSVSASVAQGSSQELGTILSNLPPRLRRRYREYRRALIKRGYYLPHLGSQLDSIPEHGELLGGVDSRASAGTGAGGGHNEGAAAPAAAAVAGAAGAPTESKAGIQGRLALQPEDQPRAPSSAALSAVGALAVGASGAGAFAAADKSSHRRSLPRALLEERESPDSFGFVSQSPEDRWTHHRVDWILLASSVLVAMCAILYYIVMSLRLVPEIA